MIRKIAVLGLLWCAACYSSGRSLGTCNVAADCTLPDGACELQGPRITNVSAPTAWTPRSQQVTVTAVVDDTGGPGIASAVLRIAGASNIVGTTTDTGLVRTYTFSLVGSTVQAADSEAPIAFTVVATDTGGGTTPDRA